MAAASKGSMVFEELHSRYGTHVAKRVQHELTPIEFDEVAIEALPAWLETRAELAHKAYQAQLDNPFFYDDAVTDRDSRVDALYRRWKEAEDLSYIIAVAEDVNAQAHVAGK